MKNHLLLITASLLSVMMISSCRYKDGPKFTIKSAKTRAVNDWVMGSVLENGVDKTSDFNSLFKNWKLSLKDDNKYVLSYEFFVTISENGTWEFQENGIKLNLKKDGTGTNVWTITRLKTNDMWLEQVQSNGDLIQYKLKH